MNSFKKNILVSRIIPFILIALTLLEICAFILKGSFSVFASRIWASTGIFLLVVFLIKVLFKVIYDVKEGNFILILGFLLIFGIFCAVIFSRYYSDISPEASIQLADGLEGLEKADWNYTGTGFLGYPAKQYILASAPTLILGRNVFAAHLGFAYLFLIGFILLFFELRNLTKIYELPEYFALLPCAALITFPYITEYYRIFEQTIMPVSFCMICTSMYIRYLLKHDAFSIMMMAFSGGMLSGSYTPALSCVPLIVLFLLLNATGYWQKSGISKRKPAYSITPDISLIIYIAGCFTVSLLTGRNDRATVLLDNLDIFELIKKSIPEFLMDVNARFFGVLISVSLIYIILSLLLQLHLYNFIISGWILAVSISAHFLGGYAVSSSESVIMQRCMVFIPVLITSIYLIIVRLFLFNGYKIKKLFIPIMYVFMVAVGLYNFTAQHKFFTYLSLIRPVIPMLNHIDETLKNEGLSTDDTFGILLYSDNTYIHNLNDYTCYYYPNAVCKVFKMDELDSIYEDSVEFIIPALREKLNSTSASEGAENTYASSIQTIPVICLSQDRFENESESVSNIRYIDWEDHDSLYNKDISWSAAVINLDSY